MLDAQLSLQALQEAGRAFDEATGAQADIDDVLAPGRQTEGVVKAGDPENLGQGNLQLVRDVFQGWAREPVEMPVNVQHHREQIPGLIPVSGDDTRHHGFVGDLGVSRARLGRRFRQLYLKADGADFQAGPASRALGVIDVAGFLLQGGREMTRFPGNVFKFGQGKKLDIRVPADLDQLGGDNSHGTIIGGKGFVDLRHGAADGRAFFHQVDEIAGIGQIQGGLHPGDTTADHHHRSQNFV